MIAKMKLNPASRIFGRLTLPGDKSISHRAALIAALANGVSTLTNFATSRDCESTIACLRKLGVEITHTGDLCAIHGREKLTPAGSPLDCGNSGSTMRILAGVLAAHDFTSELTGDESLSLRPMKRIIEPLELMGARIEACDGKPPLKIRGSGSLRPITYKLPVASAQVKSAILFAALGASGQTEVIETIPSRDHTERLFNGFGVPLITAVNPAGGASIRLDGPARFAARDLRIPGDVSSAAYLIAAAMMLPGSDLTLLGVGLNPSRTEFLSVLRSWGAEIITTDLHSELNEPVGTIQARAGPGSEPSKDQRTIRGSVIPSLIDELPLLAVVGSQISGGVEIRDAGELRLKESDRLRATTVNLRAMGAEVEEYEDGLSVVGPAALRGARVDSFGDHRIAMAFSVAALIAVGTTEMVNSECINISFPEFFDLLERVTAG